MFMHVKKNNISKYIYYQNNTFLENYTNNVVHRNDNTILSWFPQEEDAESMICINVIY